MVDSAGIVIVQTERFEWDSPGVVTVGDSAVFRIGSSEDGPYSFSNVGGVAIDSSGRIFVADRSWLEIRAFAASGEHLWSSGAAGAGPGEY